MTIAKLTRIPVLCLILTWPLLCHGEGMSMGLVDLIEKLRQQGLKIIYSDRLVPVSAKVSVESVSLDALRRSLTPLGLSLRASGPVWIVTRLETLTVTGFLYNSANQPLKRAFVRVLPEGTRHYGDNDGHFRLENVPPGAQLLVGAIGYESQLLEAGQADLGTLILIPASRVENIIVTGSRYRFPFRQGVDAGFTASAPDMALIPALAGDAMRVANRLPGVSSVGVSAKPRIRGGLQDEVLILLDGVELLEAFHLADFQNGYSSIDHRTVEAIDIYTGGFPARYGNRMSGVMDVTTDRTAPDYASEIGYSSFSTFINSRSRTTETSAKKNPMQWLLSARHGDLGDLTELMEPRAGHPRYTDISARFNRFLADGDELYGGLLGARDSIHFTDDEELAEADINSYYLWSGLRLDHGQYLNSAWLLTLAGIDREKNLFSEEPDGKAGFLDYRQSVDRISLRNDYRLQTDDHLHEFGLEWVYGRSRYDLNRQFDRGELAAILGIPAQVDNLINTRIDGPALGLYLSTEWSTRNRWTWQPSIRWDYQDYYRGPSEQQISPRLGALYRVSDQSQWRFSLGRFYQPDGLHELQVIDGEEHFFRAQASDQAIIGYDWQQPGRYFRGEVYYKRYRNPKRRYENLFNPFVLLPEMEPDRVALNPDKALSQGLDLSYRHELTPSLTGHLRYGYMDSEDSINGTRVPRRWSQRHTLNAMLTWERDDYSLSLALLWHSGWRSTQLPESIAADEPLAVEHILNNTELRDYLSLDISGSRSWRLGPTRITLHFDITNLGERDNVAGIDFEAEQQDDRIFFTPEAEMLLPLVASAGIVIAF